MSMSPVFMHEVKVKVEKIASANKNLKSIEFFMPQMIEENRKKVYWKTGLQFHISALFNQILACG